LNEPIVWHKRNPQPAITTRILVPASEQIVWAVNETPERATGWTFNYDVAKRYGGGKQLHNVWSLLVTSQRERELVDHPAQKPIGLIERLVQ